MNVHFIAIGGSVMHQLAIALHKKGYQVTGSDDEIFEPASSNLQQYHLLPPQLGWHANNIHAGLDAVILGMHAKEDNVELLAAKALGLKIYSFPEYIFEESKNKKRIVVGGSHGKTSTTAMIMHVLQQCHKNFDYLVGAQLPHFTQSVNITHAPLIVCEGDEYPASIIEKKPKFHFLYPHVAIITGIAWDHINVFPTYDFYVEQFNIFIHKIESGGTLIYCAEDAALKKLVENATRKDITYLPYTTPKHTIHEGKTTLLIDNEKAELAVFGKHNLQNIMAAYLACKTENINTKDFLQAISSFTGAAKRLELIAKNNTCIIYRDFAHAPSKVKATIEAVKNQYPTHTLIAFLELHTYSSLNKTFLKEYQHVFNGLTHCYVHYSAHALAIKKMPALTKTDVMEGFDNPNLTVTNTKEELMQILSSFGTENTVILLMSSGNFDGIDIKAWAKEKVGIES
jgi:UDP-N-acetylmuramate: L-alanyl-gamma-D-glutamyl-meso-diaminopimelate ligase